MLDFAVQDNVHSLLWPIEGKLLHSEMLILFHFALYLVLFSQQRI